MVGIVFFCRRCSGGPRDVAILGWTFAIGHGRKGAGFCHSLSFCHSLTTHRYELVVLVILNRVIELELPQSKNVTLTHVQQRHRIFYHIIVI